MNERRYRLRNDNQVSGYLREIHRSLFYSKDGFWWTGKPIAHKQRDEWVGYRDKNNQYVFEWDILYFRIDPDKAPRKGVVLWQKKQKCFGILDLEEMDVFIPFQVENLELFNPRQFEVFSQLYINPEIMEVLGLKDE
jgi:hypothetical protein